MENILFYIQKIDFNFTLSMIILLTILSATLLGIVLTIKSPKITMASAVLGIVTFLSWTILIVLLLSNILPIHEEDFMSCGPNCIGVYPIEVPTVFVKIVATLPFISIILIVVTLISRKAVIATEVKNNIYF